MRPVVAPLILHVCILISYVLSVMRVVLRVLLTINERHTIDVIVLVIVVFVSSHDQVLLSSLQAHSSHWLGSIAGYVDVCHVVILVASLSLVVGVHGRK